MARLLIQKDLTHMKTGQDLTADHFDLELFCGAPVLHLGSFSSPLGQGH